MLFVKHTQDENGMEAYRMLMKEYQPVNRARSLELFHNILNYWFHKDKGIAENTRNALNSTRSLLEKRRRKT